MNFNTEQEKERLKQSFLNTENLSETLEYLEQVLIHRTPFALYIATADKTNCLWLFDKDTVCQMIGGVDKYDQVRAEMLPTEEDKSSSVLFFILRKVGPLYSIRLGIDLIEEIISELYEYI